MSADGTVRLVRIHINRKAHESPNPTTGEALYQHALGRAEAMGWRLNWEVKGHRVSDFPHAIYKAGDLGGLETCPKTGVWILEIQLAHPSRPFGAFYEDLLIAETATA